MELQPILPVLKRKSFPDGFIFGAASSAYQYEGAVKEDGRKPSIWDTFTHNYPDRIKDHSTGNVAIDSYHRYKEDIAILKKIGLDAYRFSISWSRILPNGKRSEGVNSKGVEHYSDFIDELIANGIEPFVTLFHWDLPQALEDEGGFLNEKIVDYFRDFVEVCFENFGNRVKHWITLNEPYSYSYFGYILGYNAPCEINIPLEKSDFTLPPSRYSSWQPKPTIRPNIHEDFAHIPYLVTHYQILAHLAAVEMYRNNFQKKQGGIIGITLVTNWMKPYYNSPECNDAKQRGLDFMFGWFMGPITHGDYPDNMKTYAQDRLPKFHPDEKDRLKMSYDFLGLNYYTSNYASPLPLADYPKYYIPDSRVLHGSERDGMPIGEMYDSTWIYCCPDGLRDLLKYIKEQYNDPVIYITENGIDEPNRDEIVTVIAPEDLIDYNRVEYHYLHLSALQEAINAGVNVKGYFVWSLLDNFEWNSGYTSRFGINYVDYKDGLKRYQKLSAIWFKMMLKKENIKNSTKTLEN